MRILIISIALASCVLYWGLEAHSSQISQNYTNNQSTAAKGVGGTNTVNTQKPAGLAQAGPGDGTIPQNAAVNMQNPSDEYNHVESIGFEVQQGMGIVTVGTSWTTQYERLQDEDKKITVKLKDVILADKFQVSRDVSDFDSPINFISSFRDPIKPNDVIMVIELKEKDVPVDIGQNGNTITMNFGKTREQEKVAAEKGEVNVAVKPEDLYAFDFRLTSIPGATKTYKGQLVSFDFKDADIRDVLRIISDISGLNMIISRNVTGTVTLKLTNVPWDQALDVILEDAGLGAFIDGNVLRVAPLATLQARQKAVKKAAETSEELEPLITKQVFVNYASAEELIPLVEPLLSDRGELRVDTRTNSILINDTGVRVARIEGLVADL
ncbi:MAG TPA: secretin and TonB N-terminal domain-containing protein, partial [Thermodesulfobacteriota bacterium]|nr:secretin and TonB N-terminal domain-containing protein [Thermodesulfobacteriota bacterium]